MKLSKFFKYGFLAIGLLGSTIAMEEEPEENGLGQYFNVLPRELMFIINNGLSVKENLTLAQTCWSWKHTVDEYFQFVVPSKDFSQEININIHPDLCGEITNFACTSQSLCIFLPFQENTAIEETTVWEKTRGWSIDGRSWAIQKLQPFGGEISWCCAASHPQGIVLGALNQAINLLTVSDATIEIKPAFPGIEEADGFGDFFPNFLCNASNAVFIRIQNDRDMISCYNLNNVQQKYVAVLPSRNSRAFNFGEKFLVMGSYPNSLQMINPQLNTLVEKAIGLPAEIISQDVILCDLTSDQDSILISAQNSTLPNSPVSYFSIADISSDQPVTTPVSFLSKGYRSVGCYLKNNYIFSVASLIVEQEATVSHEPEDTFDVKINEKSGVFAIHDLNNQLMYKKFFPSRPFVTYCVGNTVFVEIIIPSIKADCGDECEEEACPGYYFTDDTNSLLAFNIKKYL